MGSNKRGQCELLSVGNELLMGRTLNTNAHWLAQQLTGVGANVTRAVTVRDDVQELAEAVRAALSRNAQWLIISGGLGPTYDDRTLEGLARALRRPLRVHAHALRLIREHYRHLAQRRHTAPIELTPARRKMATLPRGAIPLPNPVGTAPGVLLRHQGTSIVCVPGVPAEMQAIMQRFLPQIAREVAASPAAEATLHVYGVMESSLAPLLDQLLHKQPGLYVKSHPRTAEGQEFHLEIHMIARAATRRQAERGIGAARQRLTTLIRQVGGHVESR